MEKEISKNSKWYIIQVRPACETKVKDNLENKVFDEDGKEIEQIFLPLSTTTSKNGTKKSKPMFPGYLFIKLNMTENSWYTIRNTEDVIGIIGSSGRRVMPTPIPESQIEKILTTLKTQKEDSVFESGPKITNVNYAIGDEVGILEGNFYGQKGKVKDIIFERQEVNVEIEFFGRKIDLFLALNKVKKN